MLLAIGGLSIAACKNGSGFLGLGGNNNSATPVATSDLPQKIHDYIATNYPGLTIQKAEKEDEDGTMQYNILLSDGTTELKFDLDGNFLHAEQGGGNEGNGEGEGNDHENGNDGEHQDSVAIPQAALTWLQTNFPNMQYEAEADTLCDGTAVVAVDVDNDQNNEQGGNHDTNDGGLTVLFQPDGTYLATETELAYADLPQAVKDAVAAAFPGATTDTDATKIEYANGILHYEVSVKQTGGTHLEVTFDAAGALLCQQADDDDDHE